MRRHYYRSPEATQILIAARIHRLKRLAAKTSATLEDSMRVMSWTPQEAAARYLRYIEQCEADERRS